MDRAKKDQVKGEAKDIKGRVERQAGEWTGDPKTQAKGIADQAAGKTQKAVGKLREQANKARKNLQKRDDGVAA
jgi:uncharacterized protein YjbJ (UPF0337 family)